MTLRKLLFFAILAGLAIARPQALVEQQTLVTTDGAAFDEFGSRVAIDGDTALVGANLADVDGVVDQGAVYVFTRTGGTWTLEERLVASDGAAGDRFGSWVAISGDTALIGAVHDDVDANANQGSAYVFTRTAGVWTEHARLTAADGAAGDEFGHGVALDGNTALIGARLGGARRQGAAYVFTRSGDLWTEEARLAASDGQPSDGFGAFVALAGDTAVIGAHDSNSRQGSAYVFARVGSAWTQDARLVAADGASGDNFGAAVAVDGETAVVGAARDDVGVNVDQGSAYVFTRVGTVWTQQARILAGDGRAGDHFGAAVSLDGETALIGAELDNVGATADQGSAYRFERTGTEWHQTARMTASDGSAGDSFGSLVALDGDTAIIGSYRADIGPNVDQGAAYVFVGLAAPPPPPPVTTHILSPAPNGNGWNTGAVLVTLNATSAAGVDSITYSYTGAASGGDAVAGDTAAFTIDAEGTTTITYSAVDSIGQIEPARTVRVRIDRTPPVITTIPGEIEVVFTASPSGGVFEFTPQATDVGGSGVVSVSMTPPGPGFPVGDTPVTINALDAAGNGAVPVSFTVRVIALVSLEVQPREAIVPVGGTQQFIGVAHFSDGSTQTTEGDGGGDSGGGGGGGGGDMPPPVQPGLWTIEFSPGISTEPCGVTGAFSSQTFNADPGTGAVAVTWSPLTPVLRADGTLTPGAAFDVGLTCADGSGPTGRVHATWSGPTATRFIGTYEFGGHTGDVVVTGWSSKAPMPQARFALGAAEAGGKLYVFGGAGTGGLFDRVDVYDPATDSWASAAPMPARREGAGVATLGGRIYVAGGNAGGAAHATVDAFDPATGTWDPSPADLRRPRAHFALVSTGTALYAIGGETGPNFAGVMSSVERFDPTSNSWTEVAPLPEPRSFLTAGALNGGATIIAAGGGNATSGASPTPYVYNVAGNTWREGPPMLFAVGLAGGAVLGNAFYLWTSGGPCPEPGQVFIPEIVTPTTTRPEGWAYLAIMPTPRDQFGIATVGDVIYAAGGQVPGSADNVSALESYTSIPSSQLAPQPPGGPPGCGPGGGGGGGGGGGNEEPTWRVLDEAIASVDDRGRATGRSPGTTTVVFEFAGRSCLETDTCATLVVGDPNPPTIRNVTPTPQILWPPNGRLVRVTVATEVVDDWDPAPACSIVSVTSNEPVSGRGAGRTTPDWVIVDASTVLLRAERLAHGDDDDDRRRPRPSIGRVYTITVRCADASGNASTGTTTVRVPQSLGARDDDDDGGGRGRSDDDGDGDRRRGGSSPGRGRDD